MQVAFKRQVLTVTGPCIRLEQPLCSFINRVQRLFFLNEAQNLSSFLIADLGVAKYPSYAVRRSRSVFSSRQHLLDYEQALMHAAELDNALEVSCRWSQLQFIIPGLYSYSCLVDRAPVQAFEPCCCIILACHCR